jgi:hypothetical protein
MLNHWSQFCHNCTGERLPTKNPVESGQKNILLQPIGWQNPSRLRTFAQHIALRSICSPGRDRRGFSHKYLRERDLAQAMPVMTLR